MGPNPSRDYGRSVDVSARPGGTSIAPRSVDVGLGGKPTSLLDLVASGFGGTFLGDLPDVARSALLAQGQLIEVARGKKILAFGAGDVETAILLDGTARAFILGPDGRQLTTRYARRGALLGTASSLAGGQVRLGVDAATPCVVARVDPRSLFELARTWPGVGTIIATEAARRLDDVYRVLAAYAFGSIRERLAAHLLELAETGPAGGLTVPIAQHDLATAVGTAREVVTRELRALRQEGIVQTGAGVEILDPYRLLTLAGPWRPGSRLYALDPTIEQGALFDHLPDAVVGIDVDGQIVYANAVASSMFGWSADELLRSSVEVLLPASVRTPFRAALTTFMSQPRRGPIGLGQAFHGLRSNGAEFPAELSLLPVDTPLGAIVFATVFDVGYRAALHELVELAQAGLGAQRRPVPRRPSCRLDLLEAGHAGPATRISGASRASFATPIAGLRPSASPGTALPARRASLQAPPRRR